MAEFNYKLEDGKYTLYKDGKPLTNPHGVVITTDNEGLAKKMEEALKKRKGYTSPKSILTYHYTYCNLKEHYGQEFVVNDFSESANYDALMGDNYLMFRQPSPVRQAIAVYFEKELPECFQMYNLYQLTAVLVVLTAYNSWMLSHYIITDICEKLFEEEKEADYETLKQEFLDDLEEFECDELGEDPDDKAYIKHHKEIGDMVDTFVYYFTLGVR